MLAFSTFAFVFCFFCFWFPWFMYFFFLFLLTWWVLLLEWLSRWSDLLGGSSVLAGWVKVPLPVQKHSQQQVSTSKQNCAHVHCRQVSLRGKMMAPSGRRHKTQQQQQLQQLAKHSFSQSNCRHKARHYMKVKEKLLNEKNSLFVYKNSTLLDKSPVNEPQLELLLSILL